jgi:hypothetical protein
MTALVIPFPGNPRPKRRKPSPAEVVILPTQLYEPYSTYAELERMGQALVKAYGMPFDLLLGSF